METSGLQPALGVRTYLNDHLADWLDRILTGHAMSTATAAMVGYGLRRHVTLSVRGEPDQDHLQHIADVLTAVGARWRDTIEAMKAAHPGTVLALFRRHQSRIDRTVIDTLIDTSPSAVIGDGHTVWVAALVPAALRLHLAEHDHGLTGLVVLDATSWSITTDVCMTFLRSLVRSRTDDRLAKAVTVGRGTGLGSLRYGAGTADEPAKLGGFGTGILDRSLTTADCLPHIRNALRF